MPEKSKNPRIRTVGFLLIALVLIYALFQLVSVFAKDVETSSLSRQTIEDTVESTAIFFRDEQKITAPAGSYDYTVENGSRVARGDKLATVYAAGNDSSFMDQLAKLEAQLASLQEIYDSGNLFDYDVTRLDEQINEAIYRILASSQTGDTLSAQNAVRELAKLMNKRSIVAGEAQVTSDEIAALEGQLNALLGSSHIVDQVYSPISGFFLTAYDPLLERASVTDAKNLTVADWTRYTQMAGDSSAPSDYVGTVVKGYEWLCAFAVPADLGLKEGNTVRLRFPDDSDDTYLLSIDSLSEASDGKVVVTVSSTSDIHMHLGEHLQPVELITSRYSGYSIPKEALKYEDGRTGVYVLRGKILRFRPVEIVYSGSGFALIRAAEDSSLNENDDVVLSGRDLYSGKVVNGG